MAPVLLPVAVTVVANDTLFGPADVGCLLLFGGTSGKRPTRAWLIGSGLFLIFGKAGARFRGLLPEPRLASHWTRRLPIGATGPPRFLPSGCGLPVTRVGRGPVCDQCSAYSLCRHPAVPPELANRLLLNSS